MGEKGTGVFSDADFFNALLSGRARSPLGGEWIFRSGEGDRSMTFTEATLVSECNRRRARGRGEGDGGAVREKLWQGGPHRGSRGVGVEGH